MAKELGNAWLLAKLVIEKLGGNFETTVFPHQRWIKSQKAVLFPGEAVLSKSITRKENDIRYAKPSTTLIGSGTDI